MEIETITDDSVTRILLRGEMTIYAATEIKSALLAAVAQGRDVEVDLTAVSEMDSAGFQCLLLAQKIATLQGRRVRCTHSAATEEVIAIYRMQGVFGPDQAAA
jgi:anti-anti-sigma factor